MNRVKLGQRLFNDVRLSKGSSLSCASCHRLDHGGADVAPKSVGVGGSLGDINAPSVFNSGLNFRQFWNGRAKDLEEQALGPIENPKEMASSVKSVVEILRADTSYSHDFAAAYADGLTVENLANAIATFERALTTPNSRFDKYLRGDKNAISALELDGYKRFKAYGCVACHQGVNVGGNMFQSMGVMGNYFADRGSPITEADLGRFAVTHREADKYVFKVPSLRNVELTAPYFHDGSIPTLEKAVLTMGKYQLGRNLTRQDVESIVAFLKSLTGEHPKILEARGER